MNAPQSVTERYVSNLLHYGRNKEFDIKQIDQEDNLVDGVVVGIYFRVQVKCSPEPADHKYAVGATISQALRRALEKHGVTFR